jgi:hypothetical protein
MSQDDHLTGLTQIILKNLDLLHFPAKKQRAKMSNFSPYSIAKAVYLPLQNGAKIEKLHPPELALVNLYTIFAAVQINIDRLTGNKLNFNKWLEIRRLP